MYPGKVLLPREETTTAMPLPRMANMLSPALVRIATMPAGEIEEGAVVPVAEAVPLRLLEAPPACDSAADA